MFGLFGSKKRQPRWGFSAGWDDYVVEVRAQLSRRGIALDDRALKTGRVDLPDTADFEWWDLASITERCRDAEPAYWEEMLEQSLDEAFGSPSDAPKVEVLEREPPMKAQRPAKPKPSAGTPAKFDPPLTRDHLRVQLFSGQLAAMLSDNVAKRPLGDAAMILVADMMMAESTLAWADIEQLGLERDEAFVLGRRNAALQMVDGIQTQTFSMPGATGEILVANGFFLGGAMLEVREHLEPGLPLVIAPITWHHWVSFEIKDGATRATLAAMRDFVTQLADSITTIRVASAWVTRSLWWWPSGTVAPVVLEDGALPAELAARLA